MPNKLSSEEVLAKIGASDFRSINKTQLIEFVSAIPEMDKETAIKCIEQFPNFTEYASGVVKDLYGLLDRTIKDDKDVETDAILSHQRIIEILAGELDNENASEQLKMHIINNICAESIRIDERAKEHQALIKQTIQIAASIGASTLLVAGAILGVRFLGKRN